MRLFKISAGVIPALVILSVVTHVWYREIPAVVVGNELDISSGVDGTIAQIHRQVNEAYQRGDELVTVESEGLRTQLAAVERDLEQINRSLVLEHSDEGIETRRFSLQTSVASTESELRSCRAEMESVEQVLPGLREWRDLAADRLRHGKELWAEEALTAAELEERRRVAVETESKFQETLARQKRLEAKEEELREILTLYRNRLASLPAERTSLITELELKAQEKEGLRDRLLASLDELRIVADHDGIVTEILRKEGEYVHSGGPILRVMRNEAIWVHAYMRVSDKSHIKTGDRVKVVGDVSVSSLAGRVSKVLPVLQPLPLNQQSPLGRNENYAVLVITMDDPELARAVLSPAQQVTAKVKRRFGFLEQLQASAQGRDRK
jgi:multidrug resistance efflux pump